MRSAYACASLCRESGCGKYVPKRLARNEARDSEQDEAVVAAGVREENKWEGFSHVPQAPGPLGDPEPDDKGGAARGSESGV